MAETETVSPRAIAQISSQVAAVELSESRDVSECWPTPSSSDQNDDAEDVENVKGVTKAPPRRIDTDALTGLRGLAAFHVALGHYLGFSGASFDLIGGASMSFFYLLSGFVMTIGYASKAINRGEVAVLDKRRFWRNRFARLVPTYMLVNVFSFTKYSIWWTCLKPGESYASFAAHTPYTWLGINMWLFPINFWKSWIPLPISGATWTVQTMFFFYVMFPWIFRVIQRAQNYYAWMAWLYIFQAVSFVAICFGATYADHSKVGYWVARSWPPLRLMVFVMGCLAAVRRMRDNQTSEQVDRRQWGRVATGLSMAYFVLTVVGIILQRILCPESTTQMPDHVAPDEAMIKLLVRTLWEPFMPALFVALIVALSYCEDQGLMARLCRSTPMQWFGNVSMAFYMFHCEVIGFFAGALQTGFDNEPGWCFVVGLPIAVVIAWVVTRFFEEPCRKFLRA